MDVPTTPPASPPQQLEKNGRHLLAGVYIGYGNITRIRIIDTTTKLVDLKIMKNAFTGVDILSEERINSFAENIVKKLIEIRMGKDIGFSRVTIATPGKEMDLSNTIKKAVLKELEEKNNKGKVFKEENVGDKELACLPEPHIYHYLFFGQEPKYDRWIRLILYADKTTFLMGTRLNKETKCQGSKGPRLDAPCFYTVASTALGKYWRCEAMPKEEHQRSKKIFEDKAKRALGKEDMDRVLFEGGNTNTNDFDMDLFQCYETLVTALYTDRQKDDHFSNEAFNYFSVEFDELFLFATPEEAETEVVCFGKLPALADDIKKLNLRRGTRPDEKIVTWKKSSDAEFDDPAYAAAALSAISVLEKEDTRRNAYVPSTEDFKTK